ncbi:MAG: YgaP family membrane protein [Solirubrobacterales bacterium]
MSSTEKTWNNSWPLERILFAIAGVVILVSVLLAVTVSTWFLLLTAFVGVNQLLYASVGFCGASLILSHFTKARPACAAGASQ